MNMTTIEQKMFNQVMAWEERIYNYETSDFEVMFEKTIQSSFSALPEAFQKEFFTTVDNMLFHLHAMIQGSQFQSEARERIVAGARIFQDDVEDIEDLKNLRIDQLHYIAQQQIAKYRFYSFSQGGISGMGGPVLLASDIPSITVINLRLVQLIALSYGYEVNTPKEMMISLKVFHTGTLPVRLQSRGLDELKESIVHNEQSYFYDGNEEIIDSLWLEQPIRQIMKYIAISIFRKKKLQGLPVLSMLVGAGSNYALTKQVSEFAHHFYQYRYFLDKEQV